MAKVYSMNYGAPHLSSASALLEIPSAFEGKWMFGFCLYKLSPYLLLKGCIQQKSLSEIESLHSLQWKNPWETDDDDGYKI